MNFTVTLSYLILHSVLLTCNSKMLMTAILYYTLAYSYLILNVAHSCFSTAVSLGEMYPFCPVQLKEPRRPFLGNVLKSSVTGVTWCHSSVTPTDITLIFHILEKYLIYHVTHLT